VAKTKRKEKRDGDGVPIRRKPGAGKDEKRGSHKSDRTDWKKRKKQWES
jgi:hypothetical protein